MAKQSTPPARFTEDGRKFVLRDVHLLKRGDTDLWNDRMYLRIDHRGMTTGGYLQPDMTTYADALRAFYVRDDQTGNFFSAPYEPVQAEPDLFECTFSTTNVTWHIERDGLAIDLRVVIPRDDLVELWTATVTNITRRRRKVSLYSFLPIKRGPLVSVTSYNDKLQGVFTKDTPYWVKLDQYEQLKGKINDTFAACDTKPTAYETSISDFVGNHALHNPDAMAMPKLKGKPAGQPYFPDGAGIFQFSRTLNAGKSMTFNFAFGAAKGIKDAMRIKRKYLKPDAVEKAIAKIERFQRQHAPTVQVCCPDTDYAHYLNHWLPNRMLQITRTLRYNLSPQGRNAIQDAMGGSYVDPASSRQWFSEIWAHQKTNGFLPHGMPFAEGVSIMPITRIPHKDTNVWGPGALAFYIAETGDREILDLKIPWADNGKKSSLYEHINAGLKFLLDDRTQRGLCRLGEGDWNDPLNMAGPGEKGESVWLTEALADALTQWAQVAEQLKGDSKRAKQYRDQADNCRNAVNKHAWLGRWYARGTKDNGRLFGTPNDKYGKIFLNAQSWAIIGGVADEKQIDSCLAAVNRMLMTDAGPMTLAPSYPDMDESIGKLTSKCPGTGENGSVYCHAATFWAYSLFMAGRNDQAFDVLRTLLVGYGKHTIEQAGQLPLYIPNFFAGAGLGRHAGRSSHSPTTGTVPWYYRTAISMLFGVRAEFNGLRIDPHLPKHWPAAAVNRIWRGATFQINIQRQPNVNQITVTLNGELLEDNCIPPRKPGSKHQVEVIIPG